MNDFMLMAPANLSFSELFSNGIKFQIPKFQRDYAWGIEQWEDLWTDLMNIDEEGAHYMGYIVLQKKGEHEYDVIDGQQRLITISIIILAVLRKLQELAANNNESDDNNERLRVIRERFIGSKNLITLIVDNKLSLNRNNRRHFRELCSNLEILKERNLSKTNQLLNKVFEFFLDKINAEKGSDYGILTEKITSKLIFTRIVTHDTINAYKVFETLNARGIQLSTPDLLKNHIFSTLTANDDVTDEHLDILDEDWAIIIEQLGAADFTDFVRYHHNIQKKLVIKSALFRSIKESVSSPILARNYLTSIKEYAPVYSALQNPNDEWWVVYGDSRNEIVNYLEGLKLFEIKQPFSVLMAAAEKKFTHEEFVKVLKYLYVLSVRYNIVCRLSPNEQEKAYNSIAIKVFNDEFKRASHIKNCEEFNRLYPDDDTFKNAFQFLKFQSRKDAAKIRFLLTEIENHLGRSLNFRDVVLEHVCPYNPDPVWLKAFGQGINDVSDRLGNMVLLDRDDLQRASFSEKQKVYQGSGNRLAQEVSKYQEWTLASVNKYQEWLASQAVKAWRVD
jgi:uncharacterized protein with ParB-like and HNH nuclease domain